MLALCNAVFCTPSQVCASAMPRVNESMSLMDARGSRVADAAPVGSSEGRAMRRPLETLLAAFIVSSTFFWIIEIATS